MNKLLELGTLNLSNILNCKVSFLLTGQSGPTVISATPEKVQELPKKSSLPPIFAHVIQTRRPLWWKTEKDLESLLPLKKKIKKENYSGNIASIIPIVVGDKSYGALSVTNFRYEQKLSSRQHRKFVKNVVESFLDLLGQTIVRDQERDDSRSERITNKLIDSVSTLLVSASTEKDIVAVFLNEVKKEFGFTGIYLSLQQDRNLKLVAETLPSEETKKIWNEIPFKARPENRASPFAIAMNDHQPIYIENISILYGILEKVSIDALSSINTVSCILLPLTLGKSEFGLISLFSNQENQVQHGNILKLLNPVTIPVVAKLSEIKKQGELKRTDAALSLMIDPSLLGDIKNVLEKGERISGSVHECFSIVLDLRGSSQAARHYRADEWAYRLHELYSFAQKLAEKSGALVEKTVGDGIVTLVRRSSNPNGYGVLDLVLKYYSEVTPLAIEQMNVKGSLIVAHYGKIFIGISGHQKRVSWDMSGAAFNDTFNTEKVAKKYNSTNRKEALIALTSDFVDVLPPEDKKDIEDYCSSKISGEDIALYTYIFDHESYHSLTQKRKKQSAA